jgi:chemotaxis signal transduction protein
VAENVSLSSASLSVTVSTAARSRPRRGWLQRAVKRMERARAPSDSLGHRTTLPARIGPAWLLLDAEIIHEILGAEVWLPIPGARAEMPGVVAWRGRAIPVVDLAAPFGFERLRNGETRARTLIASVAQCIVAVPVDAAREVHAFSTNELKPVSVTNLPYATAEAELFERVLALVDLPRFVAEILGGAAPELGREGMVIHAAAG